MVSKNTLKQLQSLQHKKFRKEYGFFVAEGERLVSDLIVSQLKIKTIYHTHSWKQDVIGNRVPHVEVNEMEMKKLSGLSTQSSVLAVVEIPKSTFSIEELKEGLTLVLDDVQDPGNLGTIIRLADWFGIKTIVCSTGSADAFSPKVVQSTMGAISRVKVIYTDLKELIENAKLLNINVYGTFMQGSDIYKTDLPHNALLVMGNEGNGISQSVEKLIQYRLTIPSFTQGENTSESLNVAMATAIACSEFRRRMG